MRQQDIDRHKVAAMVRSIKGVDSNVDAAGKTGIDPETIRLYGKGTRIPTEANAKKLCVAYGVDPTTLLEACGYDKAAVAPSEVADSHADYITFSADATNERLERLEKEVGGLRADLDRIVGLFSGMAGIVRGRGGEKSEEDRHG